MLMFSVVLTENHNEIFQHKIAFLKKQHQSHSLHKHSLRSKLSTGTKQQQHLALSHNKRAEPEDEKEAAKAKIKDYVLDKVKEWSGTKSVDVDDLVKAYMVADTIKDTTEKVTDLIEAFQAGEQALGEVPIVDWFFLGLDLLSTMKCEMQWNEPEFVYTPTHEVPHPNKHLGFIDGTDTVVNDCDDDTTIALLRIGLFINKLVKKCDEELFCTSIDNVLGSWSDWMTSCQSQTTEIGRYISSFGLKTKWMGWKYQGKWDPQTLCMDCYNDANCQCYWKYCD